VRDQLPIRTARRGVRRQERESLGLAKAPCVLCIQQHHLVHRKRDEQLTGPYCKMHHQWIHEQMRRAGISPRRERNPARRVAASLRAIAVHKRALANTQHAQADVQLDEADAIERWASSLEDYAEAHHEQKRKRR
jgi:hypothetical protein